MFSLLSFEAKLNRDNHHDYLFTMINYFLSWHIGTTNKLLQTALQKWTHSSRQPEAAVITYRHTVGEKGLVLNWPPPHHYQIIQEVLYQQLFRWHGRWCIVWWTWHEKSDTDSDKEGKQMFSEESDNDECFGIV